MLRHGSALLFLRDKPAFLFCAHFSALHCGTSEYEQNQYKESPASLEFKSGSGAGAGWAAGVDTKLIFFAARSSTRKKIHSGHPS
jgi:hypothetical protein